MVAEFGRRRDRIVDLLNAIPGFKCHRPAGAFYVFPDITGTGSNERELATSLLDEVGVAVLPGTSFGPYGKGHIRLSYAASIANLEEAARRIAQYVGGAVVAG
jgi:aspartate/methionine/tyrosine aminotransferase